MILIDVFIVNVMLVYNIVIIVYKTYVRFTGYILLPEHLFVK